MKRRDIAGFHNYSQKRISPWIKKKLNEIIGEDEPTLIVFISDKLASECKPEQILSEIRVVLGLIIPVYSASTFF
jgi:hypothetical protein